MSTNKMAESDETLDLMEQRISNLEKLVFGPAEKDADYPKVNTQRSYF